MIGVDSVKRAVALPIANGDNAIGAFIIVLPSTKYSALPSRAQTGLEPSSPETVCVPPGLSNGRTYTREWPKVADSYASHSLLGEIRPPVSSAVESRSARGGDPGIMTSRFR